MIMSKGLVAAFTPAFVLANAICRAGQSAMRQPSFSAALNRIRLQTVHFGIPRTCGVLALLALKRAAGLGVWKCVVLDATSIPGMAANAQPLPVGYSCRSLSHTELAHFARDPILELDTTTLCAAWGKQDLCVGVIDERDPRQPRLAAYGFYSTLPTAINHRLEVHISGSYAYVYKVFTHPHYRGQRLYSAGIHFAARHYRRRNSRGLVAYIEEHNLASARFFARLGFNSFGRVGAWRGKRFFRSAGCQQYGFEVVPVPPPPVAGKEDGRLTRAENFPGTNSGFSEPKYTCVKVEDRMVSSHP